MNRLCMLSIGCFLLGNSALVAAVDARGSRPCTAWIAHRAEQLDGHALNSEIDQTWLIGYLSGVVAGAGIDFLTGTDNESIFVLADDYCQTNPLGHLATAGTTIARTLMARKAIVNVPTLR